MLARGRLFKKAFDSSTPVNIKAYVEVYLTDREYLSNEDAKLLKKRAARNPSRRNQSPCRRHPHPSGHPADQGLRQRAVRLKNALKRLSAHPDYIGIASTISIRRPIAPSILTTRLNPGSISPFSMREMYVLLVPTFSAS